MTEILSELHSENEVLKDLALGKNPSSRQPRLRNTQANVALQYSNQNTHNGKFSVNELRAIDVQKISSEKRHAMQYHGYLDRNGEPTLKLMHCVERNAEPNSQLKDFKKGSLLECVGNFGQRWRHKICTEFGLFELSKACQLQQEGWFSRDGVLSSRAVSFLQLQRDEQRAWLSSKLSAQHIGLMSVLASRDGVLDKDTYYKECKFKTPWEVQQSRLDWMKKHGLLDKWNMPTELGEQLRAAKTPLLTIKRLNLRDSYIEQYLKDCATDDTLNKLKTMRPEQIESRIFRLKVSGFLDGNNLPTPTFERVCDTLRESAWNNTKPIWILENRAPQLDDLNQSERELLNALATESPYLSLNQIKEHFGDDIDTDLLRQGNIIQAKTIDVQGAPTKCVSLSWNAKPLTRELGIKEPLKGRFQRDSHVKHDLMLWESLQDFKKRSLKEGIQIEKVTHERAIYSQKTSANDNKGVSTPDLIASLSTGEDVAIEYGNYAIEQMVKKVKNFPQQTVYVYSSDVSKLERYQELYSQQVEQQYSSKIVTWIHLPEILL